MQKIIIGIAGEMASGKGTIARYIETKYEAAYWSYSRIMRDILDRLYVPQGRKELAGVSLTLRKEFGQDLFAITMKKDIELNDGNIFVIEAVRRLPEIAQLKEIDARVVFIYVETDIQARYDRLIERGENVGDNIKSFEEFKANHELDTEMTIQPLKAHADHVIVNSGTLEELQEKVDQIMKDLL